MATYRIVSTSGIPHGDVADYRRSPEWRTGMPLGANRAWRTYLHDVIAQVTASSPDVVLHQGDMVEGRWYTYEFPDDPRVYGPRGTWAEKTRMIHNAADTIYPWVRTFWDDAGYAGGRVLWGMGDHEIGDLGSDGMNEAGTFRYKAFWHWRDAWRRHFGYIQHYNLRGNVGIVTLDPFVKWREGVQARIGAPDFDYLRDRVGRLRGRGADWIIVQCEIPAIGPNRAWRTSRLLLRDGSRLWRTLAELGVDLLLAAEFHDATATTTGGRTPMQVVHGGITPRLQWLQIDVEGSDRLELRLWQSDGRDTGGGTIWAPTRHRLNNKPVVGTPRQIGAATVHADGAVTDRSGRLTEGP